MVINVSGALSAYRQAGEAAIPGAQAVQAPAAGDDFSDVLEGFLKDAVQSVRHGESMAAQGAVGKADLQEVILAVSDAEVMMQTVTAIRDKMISAYQEVIRSAI